MKKKVSFLYVFLMFFTAAGPLAGQWAKSFHFNERDIAYSIAQTSDAGYILAGSSGLATGEGEKAILIKLNPNGDIEWQRSFAGSNLAEAKVVQQTFGGGYIVAGIYGTCQVASQNIWVAKLSPLGMVEWQQVFGGLNEEDVHSVQQTLDGGYIVSAKTNSFGAGNTDFWIVKLLPSGAIEWQKTYGGTDYEYGGPVQQTSDGGYIFAGLSGSLSQRGFWVAKIRANGDIEWQKAFQLNAGQGIALQQSSDGGYALAGNCESGIFILKLSSLGAVEWQTGFKAPQKSTLIFYGSKVAGLCQTRDNGFVVASQNGYNFNQGNIWVVKVDSQGALVWERAFRGSLGDMASCLRCTFDDCLLLAASTDAFNSKGRPDVYWDMMALKLFPQGDLNAACDLAVETGNEILEPNMPSLEADFQPQNSSAGLFPVDITMGNSNAEVHDFCSGEFFLSIKSRGGGTVEPAPGIHAYDPGSKVSITAVPSDGYKFDFWWIDGTRSPSNPTSVIMDSHRQVDAFFTLTSSTWDFDIGPKGCFIATAAYKSPLHPAVQRLRDFRDKRLLTNGPGRAFVSSYYQWSPAIARIISRSSPLRFVVRILLLPIIGAASIILRVGWFAGLAVGVGGLAVVLKKIRLIRRIG